jgi:hypothetical protein
MELDCHTFKKRGSFSLNNKKISYGRFTLAYWSFKFYNIEVLVQLGMKIIYHVKGYLEEVFKGFITF